MSKDKATGGVIIVMRKYLVRPAAWTAALIALITVGLFAQPASLTAQAFIDDPSLVADSAVNAKVTTKIFHDKVDGKEPVAGDEFTYRGEITFVGGSDGIYNGEIEINESKLAPFATPLTARNITFDSLPQGAQVSNPSCQDGRCTYTITNLRLPKGESLKATFTAKARVSSDYDGNRPVTAGIKASLTPAGSLALARVGNPTSEWDAGGCSGVSVMKFKLSEDSVGAWLMDIKYADISHGKDAQLEPLPSDPRDLAVVPGRRSTIKVTNPAGQDVTTSVLPPSVTVAVDPSDNTKPYYQTDPLLANADFVDSVNWKYNPQEFQGETFIEPGSIIEVRRGFKLRGCVPYAISTKPDPYREIIGVQVDVARKITSASHSDIDVFGSYHSTSPWCSDIYLFDRRDQSDNGESYDSGFTKYTGYTHSKISTFKPEDPLHGGPNPKYVMSEYAVFSSGIAAASQYPDRLYYITKSRPNIFHNYTWDLWYYQLPDSSNPEGSYHQVSIVGGALPQLSQTPLAFDPYGHLWVLEGTRLYRFKMVPGYGSQGATGDTAQVQYVPGSLSVPDGYTIQDLAFLDNGDLVAVSTSKTDDKIYVDVYDQKRLLAGSSSVRRPKASWGRFRKPSGLRGQAWGVAFGPDRNLYITISRHQSAASKDVYKLTPNSAPANRPVQLTMRDQVRYSEEASDGILDMASCAFGNSGGVKLRKYPIDPVTGELGPAGGNATNPALFNPTTRKNTVSYVIGIENLGSVPLIGDNSGVSNTNPSVRKIGLLRDNFQTPPGFKIERITVTDPGGDAVFTKEYADSHNQQSFEFMPGRIEPSATKYFKVSIDLEYTRDTSLSPQYLRCNTNGAGHPGTGLFNNVRFLADTVKDEDGLDNNDACIPLNSPRAHIELIKQIVDYRGKDITKWRTDDLAGFTLGATQVDASVGNQSAVSGTPVMGNAYAVAVNQDVNPGRYVLSEVSAPGYSVFGSGYECNVRSLSGGKDSPLTVDANSQIQIGENQAATCVIRNTRVPHISIRKEAADPIDSGKGNHIGKPVALNADGKSELVYKIIVRNESDFTADAYELRESFAIPAGLIHDGDITIQDLDAYGGPHGSVNYNMRYRVNPSDIGADSGIVFVPKLSGIEGGNEHAFKVTIPVKADDTTETGSGQTNWQKNAKRLGKCHSDTVGDQTVVNLSDTPLHGVVNLASVKDEYKPAQDTNELWYRDNFACIPVERETPVSVLVHKVDNSGNLSLGGAQFKVCESNPHTDSAATCRALPVLNLENCGSYPEGSATANACKAHYGAATTGGTKADTSVFFADNLKVKKDYWLVETKAPECVTKGEEYCAELLPEPLRFQVSLNGIITPYDSEGNPKTVDSSKECDPSTSSTCKENGEPYKMIGNTFAVYKNVISVRDPRQANLPVTGGSGPLPIALTSGLLIILSLGYAYRTSAIRTSPVRTTRRSR